MPPTEKSVLLWSATFAHGRSFSNYIAHLRKGCSLLGDPSDWATQTVYSAADGLMKAKKGPFKFPNFLFVKDVFALVEFLRSGSEFALVAFIFFLFSIRVPSDALQLRRAFRDDPISEPVDQPEKALIGVRKFMGSESLVIKTAWGKNLEGRCIPKRTCICSRGGFQIACPPAGFGLGYVLRSTPVQFSLPPILRTTSTDT